MRVTGTEQLKGRELSRLGRAYEAAGAWRQAFALAPAKPRAFIAMAIHTPPGMTHGKPRVAEAQATWTRLFTSSGKAAWLPTTETIFTRRPAAVK
jgi:Flp pilus assembly protein TadD